MLRVKVSPENGRGLFAEKALEADVLGPLAPYAQVPFDGFCVCGKPSAKKCTRCRACVYCSAGCQKADWTTHKAECAALAELAETGRVLPTQMPMLRLLARTMNRLQVEDCTPLDRATSHPRGEGALLQGALLGALGTGNAVLSLETNREAHSEHHVLEYGQMASAVLFLMRGGGGPVPGNPTFVQPSAKAVIALFCSLKCNVFTQSDSEMRPWGIGLYPAAALLNHSCAPNAIASFTGSSLVVRTTQPVAAGEQVTISYTDVAAPSPMRRAQLQEGYFFDCACGRCATHAAYSAAHGSGELDVSAPLALEGYNDVDLRLLGAKCGIDGCVGVHVVEVYLGPPEGGEEHGEPTQILAASTCTVCGGRASASFLSCVEDALDGIETAVVRLKACPPPKEGEDVAAQPPFKAAEAALVAADSVLVPEHHRTVALLNALVNAGIAGKAWASAAMYNERFLAAGVCAHPPGHVLPALQNALQGKLLLFLERPAEAARALQSAIDVLKHSYGAEHATVTALASLMSQAEFEARGEGDGERLTRAGIEL
jgi:SET and MYND domain-containing protein